MKNTCTQLLYCSANNYNWPFCYNHWTRFIIKSKLWCHKTIIFCKIAKIQNQLLKYINCSSEDTTDHATYYSKTIYNNPSQLYVSSSSTMCGCFNMWQMLALRFNSSPFRKCTNTFCTYALVNCMTVKGVTG